MRDVLRSLGAVMLAGGVCAAQVGPPVLPGAARSTLGEHAVPSATVDCRYPGYCRDRSRRSDGCLLWLLRAIRDGRD